MTRVFWSGCSRIQDAQLVGLPETTIYQLYHQRKLANPANVGFALHGCRVEMITGIRRPALLSTPCERGRLVSRDADSKGFNHHHPILGPSPR